MTASADPTVQRLALRVRLRDARIASGSSRTEVAESLGWPLPEFLQVEAVEVGIADGRLDALVAHYRIADDAEIRECLGVLQRWQEVVAARRHDALTRQVRLLLEFERAASAVYTFEPLLVPGLLQTREYAEAVLSLFAPPEKVETLVDARLARQDLLDRDDAPAMFFLIDESALRRWAGAADPAGRAIMRGQLDRLRELGQHPQVHIQIVPYGAGVHEGVKGSFVILELATPARDELLYLEDARGDYAGRAEPEDLRPYLERFSNLTRIAAPEEALGGFLDRALQDLDAASD